MQVSALECLCVHVERREWWNSGSRTKTWKQQRRLLELAHNIHGGQQFDQNMIPRQGVLKGKISAGIERVSHLEGAYVVVHARGRPWRREFEEECCQPN